MASFAVPFLFVWLFAQFVPGWPLRQAEIAGIALSTTSVAVVYAVTVEGGYSDTAMGQTILTACFITDFGAVLALGILFATFNIWLALFIAVMCVVLWFLPRLTRFIVLRFGATRGQRAGGGIHPLPPRRPYHPGQERSNLTPYLVGRVVAGVFL